MGTMSVVVDPPDPDDTEFSEREICRYRLRFLTKMCPFGNVLMVGAPL
jgi:hypothetical protein